MIHRVEYPYHVWGYDFLNYRTKQRGKLRILTVLDEFTREGAQAKVSDRLECLGFGVALEAFVPGMLIWVKPLSRRCERICELYSDTNLIENVA